MESVVFTSDGEEIEGDLSSPGEGGPLILMSHGLESSKDGTKWLFLEKRLNENGFATLRFNYRTSPWHGRFKDTTLTGRVEDFRAATDFLEERGITDIGVIGSSFGGSVAIAGVGKVKAMVLLATPLKLELPANEDGGIELESGRWLKPGFIEDLKKHDAAEDLKSIFCPILVVHGSEDEVVPVEQAHEIYKMANGPKDIQILEGGDHVLNNFLEKIAELSCDWFRRYLG